MSNVAKFKIPDGDMLELLRKYPFLKYRKMYGDGGFAYDTDKENLAHNWYKACDGTGWENLWKNRYLPRLFALYDSWDEERRNPVELLGLLDFLAIEVIPVRHRVVVRIGTFRGLDAHQEVLPAKARLAVIVFLGLPGNLWEQVDQCCEQDAPLVVEFVERVVPVGQVTVILHAGNLAGLLDGLLHPGLALENRGIPRCAGFHELRGYIKS